MMGNLTNKFWVVYQPVWDRHQNHSRHVEAFVRWYVETQGMISPHQIVSILTRQGRAAALDKWVAQQSIAAISALRGVHSGVTLGLRLSLALLGDLQWVPLVREWLELAGMTERDVLWEVHETVAADPDHWLALQTLKDEGFPLALDHFGSGMSFQALEATAFDVLKIDRRFVSPQCLATTRGLVREMIDLGHRLGCRVWAEGVESVETWVTLAQDHIDGVQGYAISPPVEQEAVSDFLAHFPEFSLPT